MNLINPIEVLRSINDKTTVNNGSVKGISDLSDELKERYKTKWEIKQRVVIPIDTKISLSDIDMVIQEVLFKPQVKIYVD